MMLLKKTVYDKLVANVNSIDTSGFALKTKHDTDKSGLEKKISDADKKIPDTSGLIKKLDYNAKFSEIKIKIPSISSSATDYALTAIENEISDVSNLVKKKKKTDYNAKILDIEKKVTDHKNDKYITTSEFKNLAAKTLNIY